MARELANWLPGKLSIERGTQSDYRSLSRFHYLSKSPAVWAGIWRIVYRESGKRKKSAVDGRVVAVGVLSYPTPCCYARESALALNGERYDPRKLRWLNSNLRTISRIIVHPQFRGIGLACALVRAMCHTSGVRYVEAMARMGRTAPFFERAEMAHHAPSDSAKPIYYLWDRENQHGQELLVARVFNPCGMD